MQNAYSWRYRSKGVKGDGLSERRIYQVVERKWKGKDILILLYMTAAALLLCAVFVLDLLSGNSRGLYGICATVAVYVAAVLLYILSWVTKWMIWAKTWKNGGSKAADMELMKDMMNWYLPVLGRLEKDVETIKEGALTDAVKLGMLAKILTVAEREFCTGDYMTEAIKEDLQIRTLAETRGLKVFGGVQEGILTHRKRVFNRGFDRWGEVLAFAIEEVKTFFPLNRGLIRKGENCVEMIDTLRAYVDTYDG